jgi:hypothetical protein
MCFPFVRREILERIYSILLLYSMSTVQVGSFNKTLQAIFTAYFHSNTMRYENYLIVLKFGGQFLFYSSVEKVGKGGNFSAIVVNVCSI